MRVFDDKGRPIGVVMRSDLSLPSADGQLQVTCEVFARPGEEQRNMMAAIESGAYPGDESAHQPRSSTNRAAIITTPGSIWSGPCPA